LRARRIELTKASVREHLAKGDFDEMRGVAESLGQEFDLLDVAAAAIKLAHEASAGDGDESDEDIVPPSPSSPSRPSRLSSPVRLFVSAGRKAGIKPGDLVGAITGEAGVTSKSIGAIDIADNFSIVEVSEEVVDQVLKAMKGASLRGQKVTVRKDRDRI